MFLKSKLSENRHEVKDVVYLVVFQGLNYVPSLIVLPYLIVVLGAEKFGHIGFSLAVCQILMIVVDFGFNLSASKRIALSRDDRKELDRIFSAAFFCRIGLLLSCFVILAAISFFPNYEIYRPVLFAKFTTVVGEAFLFTFLFQGLGKIRWVAIFNCVAKFMLLPFTFVFVKGPDDYLLAAALPGIVTIVADVMLIVMIAVSGWVSFPKFDFKDCLAELQESTPIFVSNVSNNIYLLIVVMALAHFAPAAEVGRFTASDKIIRALMTLLAVPVVQAFYPAVSRMAVDDKAKASALVKRLVIGGACLMALAATAIFIISPYLPSWLGEDYAGTEKIMRILSLMAVAASAGMLTGQLGLLASGGGTQKGWYFYIYLAATVVAAVFMFVFVPSWHGVGAAMTFLLTEIFVAVAMVVAYMKYQKE